MKYSLLQKEVAAIISKGFQWLNEDSRKCLSLIEINKILSRESFTW